jgi:hypothetical protein
MRHAAGEPADGLHLLRVLELLLEPAAVGDVVGDPQDADDLAALAAVRRLRDQERAVADPLLRDDGVTALDDPPVGFDELGGGARRQQLGVAGPEDGLDVVPQRVGAGLVHQQVPARPVLDEQGVGRPVRDRLEQRPALTQRLLGAQAVRDVPDVAAEHRRAGQIHARDRQLHRDLPAAGGERGHLDAPAEQRALAGLQVAGEPGAVPIAQRGRHEHVGELPPDDVGRRIAERPLGRRVELDDPPEVVHGHHAVERGIHDGPLAPLLIADRLLGRDPLDELAELRTERRQHVQDLPVRLSGLASEELHDAPGRPAGVDRDGDAGSHPLPLRGRAPGEPAVRGDVGDPRRGAARPDAPGQSLAGPQRQLPAHRLELARFRRRRAPQRHAPQLPGLDIRPPEQARVPAELLRDHLQHLVRAHVQAARARERARDPEVRLAQPVRADARRDVARDRYEPVPGRARHGADPPLQVHPVAVPVAQARRRRDAVRLRERRACGVAVGLVHELERAPAEQLLGPVSQHPLMRRRRVGDAAVRVEDADEVEQVLDDAIVEVRVSHAGVR